MGKVYRVSPEVSFSLGILLGDSLSNRDIDYHYGVIHGSYHKLLHSIAYGYVYDDNICEDLVSITFMKCFKKLGSYEGIGTSFGPWLVKILRNTCIDYLRRQRIDYSFTDNIEVLTDDNPETIYLDSERLDLVREAILQLENPTYRTAMCYYYYDDLSIDEISILLGNVSTSTVKSYLHRGRSFVRKYLVDYI